MTTTETTTEIPVRLDFDNAVQAFSRALSHLDGAATKELDRVGMEPELRGAGVHRVGHAAGR